MHYLEEEIKRLGKPLCDKHSSPVADPVNFLRQTTPHTDKNLAIAIEKYNIMERIEFSLAGGRPRSDEARIEEVNDILQEASTLDTSSNNFSVLAIHRDTGESNFLKSIISMLARVLNIPTTGKQLADKFQALKEQVPHGSSRAADSDAAAPSKSATGADSDGAIEGEEDDTHSTPGL